MLQDLDSGWRYILAIIAGIIVGGYVGSMLSTFYVALVLGGSINDIGPMDLWFLEYPLSMIKANPSLLQTVLLISIGVPLFFVILGVTGVYRGSLTRYDDAHLQSTREMRKNGMVGEIKPGGFVYAKVGKPNAAGQYISADPDRFPHAIMIAPTGRGKGVGFVLPNLFHFDGSAIVLDVKGENFEKTAVHRQKGLGNEIFYFSPFDYQGVGSKAEGQGASTRTHRFNPLARIAAMQSTEQQYTALNTLADLFLTAEGASAQGFFQNGKRLFVASCLLAIEQGIPTLSQASEIMGGGGDRIANYKSYAESTSNPTVARIFSEMAGDTPKIVDSYISVINGAGFELWNDPSVAKATEHSDFDFSTFRSSKQTLYISVQAEHLKTLAPLIRLLFADAVSSLQRREPGDDEPYPVMFLMDEFDQLGHQPTILNAIKTIRSFRGRFFIITQSIPGLDSIYEETGRLALFAGAGVKIFMTPQEERTAEILSSMLGKKTIESKSESQSRIKELDDSANISRRAEERALFSPGKLMQYPLDKVLILPEGQYPIEADHIRYYEDHFFAPFDQARLGHALPYPAQLAKTKKRPKLSAITKAVKDKTEIESAIETFQELKDEAENCGHGNVKEAPKRPRRRPPARKSA